MKQKIMTAIDLSALAYEEPADIEAATKDDFSDFVWIENKETDTQAFIVQNEEGLWLTFRGTQFKSLNDWLTNLDCRFVETAWGCDHRGFHMDVLSILGRLYKYIFDNDRKKYIVGYSQGGGDAEVFFRWLKNIHDNDNDICISIETPRNCDVAAAEKFGKAYGHLIYPVINNNDIVPRLPLKTMGFKHVVNRRLQYLSEDGQLWHHPSWWDRCEDRIDGMIKDAGECGFDMIKDHNIYTLQKIWRKLL
jgi:hypothetical protein